MPTRGRVYPVAPTTSPQAAQSGESEINNTLASVPTGTHTPTSPPSPPASDDGETGRPYSYRSPLRTSEELRAKFNGENGQYLLLAFPFARKGHYKALSVPVHRPSTLWAARMEEQENQSRLVPVNLPPRGDNTERWQDIRNEHCGETEVAIWERIKLLYNAYWPCWHAWIPFLRVALVEERMIRLLNKDADVVSVGTVKAYSFSVDVDPPIDSKEEQSAADAEFQQCEKMMDAATDDRITCQAIQDPFGGVLGTYHGRSCRKGEIYDHENDIVWICDKEMHESKRLRKHWTRQFGDLTRCFEDPDMARTIRPLTQGRLLESCLLEGDINNTQLPAWEDPMAGPLANPLVRGLYIEYRFRMEEHEIQLAIGVCSVLVIGLLWKVTTDSAAVGAVFGTLVIGLINLALQWQKETKAKEETKSTKKD